jgi:hypothetical protein
LENKKLGLKGHLIMMRSFGKLRISARRLLILFVRYFIDSYLSVVERIGYKLIHNSSNFFILKLKPKLDVSEYFTLYSNYRSHQEYTQVQETKTRLRLEVFYKKMCQLCGQLRVIQKNYVKSFAHILVRRVFRALVWVAGAVKSNNCSKSI